MRIDFAAIRERHSLRETAARTGYKLPASGDVFVACPMPGHDDRTPSMLLHLDTGRYHCFGCGASGDVVQWVRDIWGVDAPAAVQMLEGARLPSLSNGPVMASPQASPHRLQRGAQPGRGHTSPGRVLEALAAAWDYYTLPLLEQKAQDYLCSRGIDVSPLGHVAGHTPHRAGQLVRHLRGQGFTSGELVDAGLARQHEDGALSDVFRRRVVIPVRDDQERVIAFIGRSTIPDEHRRAPKYLNSPSTAVYDKSVALYRPSPHPLLDDGQVVIVEGALDALAVAAAAHAAGLGERFHPVSTSGLAFSDTQVEQILAIHPRAPVLALDGDPPGQQAATNLAGRMALHGREAAIVTWPEEHDPASWLQAHGGEGLTAVTRRGCLEQRQEGVLRPHHGGAEAATALMTHTGGSLQDKVAVALAPLKRMPRSAAARYAQHAAGVIAPLVVAAGASVSGDRWGRINRVLETVADYGEQFPIPAQRRFIQQAAIAIEKQQLAAAYTAERSIVRRLHARSQPTELAATGGISASVEPSR